MINTSISAKHKAVVFSRFGGVLFEYFMKLFSEDHPDISMIVVIGSFCALAAEADAALVL